MYAMETLKKRLSHIGYETKKEDEASLSFCLEKVRSTVRNETNLPDIPEGLEHIATDMAAGEFLLAKKTFAPDDLSALDLTAAVNEIKEGDTTIAFGTGEGSLTPEQRLTAYINHLLTYGKKEFSAFRRIRW